MRHWSHIPLMDEIGFFEQDALAFQAAILDALDGDIPVLAAVKAREGIHSLLPIVSIRTLW